MGFNYAHLQLLQNNQKEKLKKMEKESASKSSNGGSNLKKLLKDSKISKGKKIYPAGVTSSGSNTVDFDKRKE